MMRQLVQLLCAFSAGWKLAAGCPSSRRLQELLRVTPKENDSWTFF